MNESVQTTLHFRIDGATSNEALASLTTGLINAIRELTQPGEEPITPARSEAIYTLTEILMGLNATESRAARA